MADWYSRAVRRPMPYADQMPLRRQRRVMVMHTNGGGTRNGSLYGWFARPGNTVCSHFQVFFDGTVEQYMPLSRQAYAQHAANAFGISVEFQDEGHPNAPMTDAQITATRGIVNELDIPHAMASEDGSVEGFGYHAMYPSWNRSAHDCPGGVRLRQWESIYAAGGGGTPEPNPTNFGEEPMNVITKSDGSGARLLATDAAAGIKVYAVMSSTDLSAFKKMAPGAVIFSPLPTADYNNLVKQHGS